MRDTVFTPFLVRSKRVCLLGKFSNLFISVLSTNLDGREKASIYESVSSNLVWSEMSQKLTKPGHLRKCKKQMSTALLFEHLHMLTVLTPYDAE